MMRPRHPDGWEDAVVQIMGAIGVEACGQAVRRSTALVRGWADPDRESSLPNVRQAMLLDAAHIKATGLPGPVAAIYMRLLARETGAPAHQAADPMDRVADLAREFGEAVAHYANCGDGPIAVAPGARACKELDDLIAAATKAKADIVAHMPPADNLRVVETAE